MEENKEDVQFLPKEPVELPKPQLDLPKEIPSHPEQPMSATPSQQPQHTNEEEHYVTVQTLLAWKAPGRPFQKHGKEFYINCILIAAALEVIIFLFGEYPLMYVVLSVLFVSFALATVPPHDFHYKISTEGLTIEDHFFLWQELYDFYAKKQGREDVIIVRTKSFFPGELTITLGDIHMDQIKSILLPYLPYREVVKPTFMEKAGTWLAHTFPLDKNHAS